MNGARGCMRTVLILLAIAALAVTAAYACDTLTFR